MNTVNLTLYLSIIIQILTLSFGLYAQTKPHTEENELLHNIMVIENIVQLVEFTFYISVAFFIQNILQNDIAKYRYYDWVITTPLMLLNTMLFFIYSSKCKTKSREKYNSSLWNIFKEEYKNIIYLFLSNLGMLFVGYLQEIGSLSLLWSTILGFGFLDISFYTLYKYVFSDESKTLFWLMFIIWSLYGFAAMMKNKTKNTLYNILDVVSKNFYGLFIAYKLVI